MAAKAVLFPLEVVSRRPFTYPSRLGPPRSFLSSLTLAMRYPEATTLVPPEIFQHSGP